MIVREHIFNNYVISKRRMSSMQFHSIGQGRSLEEESWATFTVPWFTFLDPTD
jgi:hypothetical protein